MGDLFDFNRSFLESYSMRQLLLSLSLLLFLTASSLVTAAEKAPASFELKDTAGVKHKLAAYKGKWVLVNYWATWCPPCLEEVPDLVNLYDHRRKKDLMILGVVFDYKSTKEVADYVDDMLMSYPIVLGDDESKATPGCRTSSSPARAHRPHVASDTPKVRASCLVTTP